MENIKLVIISAVISALVSSLTFVGFSLVGDSDQLGAIGNNRFPNSGIAARSLNISTTPNSATLTDGTATFANLQIDSGSTIAEHSCNTAAWDPGAVSSSTVATTTVTLTGAALGDIAVVSFDSATSTEQWNINAKITGAGTSTVTMFAGDVNDTVNITTSTLRVCYFGY